MIKLVIFLIDFIKEEVLNLTVFFFTFDTSELSTGGTNFDDSF